MEKSRELPATEQSNPITSDIDVAASQDIVRLLYAADKQLFRDKAENLGLLENGTEEVMEKIAAVAGEILNQNSSDCAVVLSGCGTSGRLAFITARTFNDRLMQIGRLPIFQYLIAGGDEALFISKELTEDDPFTGITDLEEVTRGKSRVLYFGITCGLSAAYVAGQLDFCLQNLNRFTPVLLGFNPTDTARDSPIENWDKTFFQVAHKMSLAEKEERAFILNPLIGAEPITGSTRMKCGSATKILLESVFSCAYLRLLNNTDCSVRTLLECYQIIENTAFEQVDNLANLISIGGQCLNANGHIYYLSGDDLGIIGLIDASECPPTFGSDVNDVRGFLVGGFANLGNKQGDVSHVLNISVEYFEENMVPLLTKDDIIILTCGKDDYHDFDGISQRILESKATKALLHFTDSTSEHKLSDSVRRHFTFIHSVVLPTVHLKSICPDQAVNFCSQLFKEIACKWTYNVISTGAHILKGKVYQNFMIDVKVRNNKLFHRALSLIQKFGSCSKEEAFLALIRSIHNIDQLTDSQLELPISEHIRKATNEQKIVATAIIIARQQCRVEEAKKLLSTHAVIRTAMTSCLCL